MIRDAYKRAFSDILPDPALTARTEREARKIFKHKRRRSAKTAVFLAAVLIIVLAAGAALAATMQFGLLDGLFGREEPTRQAAEAVLTSGETASDAGLTLRMTEYLMDGNSLHCAWHVESQREEPVYYLTEYEIEDGGAMDEQPVGGAYGGSSSNEVGDNMLVQLTPDQSSHEGWLRNGYQTLPGAPVKVTVTLWAYTSSLTPVQAESFSAIYAPEGEDAERYLIMAERGEIGVSPEGLCWLNGYPAFEAAMAAQSEGEITQMERQALVDSGLLQPLTELSVTVTIPAATSQSGDRWNAEAATFELPDRKVVLREFSADVASTVLRYDIYPSEMPDMTGQWQDGWWYLLLDPQGRVLNADIGLNVSISDGHGADGSFCLTVICSGNPMASAPEAVTFVPTCALERKEGESSAEYYQRMAAMAAPEDCFKVELRQGG